MKKILYFTIFIILTTFTFYNVEATDINELKNKINTTNSEIDKINEEIRILSGQITETSKVKSTLNSAISDLTKKRNLLLKEREKLEIKISATNLVIKSLDNEIITKNNSLDIVKSSLSNLIYDLYKSDQSSFVEKLLSEDSISDMNKEYYSIISFNDELKKNINSLYKEKSNLAVTKIQKEDEKENLNKLKLDLNGKEIAININKNEKNTLLIQTKNKESEYQKLLKATEKRKDEFEKSLEDFEAQLKFILNPSLIPKAGSKVFSWPLDKVLVTSKYGPRWGRFHYGLDFRAAVGTPVYAMATGVIEGTGDTDIACKGASFGKWVFIKYNNGLSSTYGHLSSIKTTVGTTVKAGDLVGYSGNTGSSTGPHLHVAVYASTGVNVDTVPSRSCMEKKIVNGKVTYIPKIFTQPISALTAYLDPADYLPLITSSMVKK